MKHADGCGRTELSKLTFEGAFMSFDSVWTFDGAFWGISPRETALMDPQQRLLLEQSWHAMEDANVVPSSIVPSAMGVFVGLWNVDFREMAAQSLGDEPDFHFGTGSAPSVAAGRIAYLLNFQGPTLVIDSACSSGLAALGVAKLALKESKCESAIVAAANVITSPAIHRHFNAAGMLSSDSRCKTFDAAANGYVRSEACVAILISTAAGGEDQRPTVLAAEMNQDGRSGGPFSSARVQAPVGCRM